NRIHKICSVVKIKSHQSKVQKEKTIKCIGTSVRWPRRLRIVVHVTVRPKIGQNRRPKSTLSRRVRVLLRNNTRSAQIIKRKKSSQRLGQGTHTHSKISNLAIKTGKKHRDHNDPILR